MGLENHIQETKRKGLVLSCEVFLLSYTLNDVAGLEEQKNVVYTNLILPLEKKELFSSLVLHPEKLKERKTFLLRGPSGTGKSFFAQALANTLDAPYFSFQSTQFLTSLVGKGAQALREVYAKEEGIIFLDEIDAIGKDRSLTKNAPIDDVLLELLTCLDGASSNYNLVTLAATNRFSSLDSALISRFSYILDFPLPDALQREKIIEKKSSYFNHQISSFDFLVNKTEGFDGREIENYFIRARNNAMLSDRNYLTEHDFEVNL